MVLIVFREVQDSCNLKALTAVKEMQLKLSWVGAEPNGKSYVHFLSKGPRCTSRKGQDS